MFDGSVMDLSVGWWSVLGDRWPVGGRWFCHTPVSLTFLM